MELKMISFADGHRDYQGKVRVVLDHNSQPVELNSYYPYGGLMAATATEGTQPYKYGGKELDRENGLDLYDSQARWYDPMLARTTTLDPLAEKYYSISPYAWCAANPVKFVDPTGCIVEKDSMTDSQDQYLTELMSKLNESPLFKKLYSALENSKDFIISIGFGETILDDKGNGISEPIDAQYTPSTKKVTLKTGRHPSYLQIVEELHHAYLDMNKKLLDESSNAEFEAKTVAIIVVGEIAAGGLPAFPENSISPSYAYRLWETSLYTPNLEMEYLQRNYVINGREFSRYWQKRNNSHYSRPVNGIPQTLIDLLK